MTSAGSTEEKGSVTGGDPGQVVDLPDEEEDSVAHNLDYYLKAFKKKRVQRIKSCFKKFLTFLFSQIGICIAVACYTMLGGVIFMNLEREYEITQRISVLRSRSLTTKELWNMTSKLNILYRSNWTRSADLILQKFQKDIYTATAVNGWTGSDEQSEDQWNFAGSLLYSLTIITTIGYGHITPKTPWGRLCTIFYALPGIPLMFLCLANIGSFLASMFRLFYVSMRKFRHCSLTPWKKSVHADSARSFVKSPADFSSVEMDKTLNERSALLAFARMSMKKKPNSDAKVRTTRVNVPITVSILMIFGYVLLGALLFSLWEEDWDFLGRDLQQIWLAITTFHILCFISNNKLPFSSIQSVSTSASSR